MLAALRERRAAEEGWTLARLWKSAGLLVSSMAATVAALAVFTFVTPEQWQQFRQEREEGRPRGRRGKARDGLQPPER